MTPARRAIYHYLYWYKQKRKYRTFRVWDEVDFCQHQMNVSRKELITQLLNK